VAGECVTEDEDEDEDEEVTGPDGVVCLLADTDGTRDGVTVGARGWL